MNIISFEEVAQRFGFNNGLSRKILSWGFRFFKIDEFNEGYTKLRDNKGVDFLNAVIKYLNLEIESTNENNIPEKEAFIVISNHPHGIVDGLVLLKLISKRRPDIQVVVNDLLENIDALSQYFLSIRKESDSKTIFNNGKKILLAIRKGTPLLFFPAGSVSHLHLSKLKVQDKEWDETAIKFISKANVPVIPVHIEGRNSWLYQFLYNTAIRLSLICLIREFFNMRNKKIQIRVGDPINHVNEFDEYTGDFLRDKVYALSSKS